MKRILSTLIDLYPQRSSDIKRCYNIAKKISYDATLDIDESLQKYAQNTMTALHKDTFELKKKELISQIRKTGFWGVGDALAERINQYKDPISFLHVFKNLSDGIVYYIENQFGKFLKRGKIDLYNPKLEKRLMNSFKDLNIAFYRFITPPTTNPKVKELETVIKNMGIKEVRLGNDEKNAELIYESIKIAKANGDKLPDRIFIPIFPETMLSRCDGYTSTFGDVEKIVFLASTNLKKVFKDCKNNVDARLEKIPSFNKLSDELKNLTRRILCSQNYSTADAKRVVLHELGHVNDNYKFPKLEIKELEPRDKNIIKNLTDYIITDNILAEAYAELYAKIRADGFASLTKGEKDLFNRMISGYFDNYSKDSKKSLFKKILSFFKLN